MVSGGRKQKSLQQICSDVATDHEPDSVLQLKWKRKCQKLPIGTRLTIA